VSRNELLCNSNVKDQEICLNIVFSNDLGMVLPKQIYGLMEFNIAFRKSDLWCLKHLLSYCVIIRGVYSTHQPDKPSLTPFAPQAQLGLEFELAKLSVHVNRYNPCY